MIKTRLSQGVLVLSLSIIYPLLASATIAKQDPSQSYQDEIKQAETDAAQGTLNQLKSSTRNDAANPYAYTMPTPNAQTPPPSLRSNNEKAFSPPPSSSTNAQNNSAPYSPSSQTSKNPWVKPNPWEATAKMNPWANAPIPSPTSPPTPISPPNIFAPPQQPTSTTPTHA